MANIQDLYIIKGEDGSTPNAIQPYDLSTTIGGKEVPKLVEGRYVVNNGGIFSEYTYAAKGSKFMTKVTNQSTGEYAYINESPGVVSDLLENPSCEACVDTRPTTPTEIVSSCDKPVFVQVCNTTEPEYDLEFTDAIPICVDNLDGTFSTWYTREMIIWNELTQAIISRTTEYSSNGVTWSATAPANPYTLGSCDIDPTCSPLICEAYGNDLSTLCAGHNFSITKPSCCSIKVTTSAGSFTLVNGIQYYSTSDFSCPITISKVEVVSGNCALSSVHIISNKLN
jgi:hypothetical protein